MVEAAEYITFSNIWLLILALLGALFIASLITFFIAQKIGKSIAEKYKSWIYLLISLLPIKELIELVIDKKFSIKNPFIWFWFLFSIYCLFMFWRTRSRQNQIHKEVG